MTPCARDPRPQFLIQTKGRMVLERRRRGTSRLEDRAPPPACSH